MHSENLTVQEMSLYLFRKHTSNKVSHYALKHKKELPDLAGFPTEMLSLVEHQQIQKFNS